VGTADQELVDAAVELFAYSPDVAADAPELEDPAASSGPLRRTTALPSG